MRKEADDQAMGQERMRRSKEQGLVVVLILVAAAYAVAEEVTVTTYFPSANAMYQELKTTGLTTLALNPAAQVGIGTRAPAAGFRLDIVGGNARATDWACNNCLNQGDLSVISVHNSEIADFAVGTSEILDNAVTTAKLADGSIGSSELASATIGEQELASTLAGPALRIRGTAVDIPVITVDEDGRITAIGTVPLIPPLIPGGSGTITTGSLTASNGMNLTVNPWDPDTSPDSTISASGGAGGTLDCLTVEDPGKYAVCPAGYTPTGCGTYNSGKDDQVVGNACFNDENHVWAACCRVQ